MMIGTVWKASQSQSSQGLKNTLGMAKYRPGQGVWRKRMGTCRAVRSSGKGRRPDNLRSSSLSHYSRRRRKNGNDVFLGKVGNDNFRRIPRFLFSESQAIQRSFSV